VPFRDKKVVGDNIAFSCAASLTNKQTNKQTLTVHMCVHPFLMLSSLRCVSVMHHVLYPLP
jgi:hypothetical protein